ncbi:FAD-dependent monooxygenase [Chelatococcus sambhunathii]|uniref:FAD-dependent monooxygenase n=1 Tax=Chelatococcus sambhunathii TaxID=363953 RepID=A0ABU1DE79_9HYPH|nr:FAD-dependent monooxygenase [Chelatococcus sambhunathii]MDR4306416.1 FAD-dependent monooxygenase [Chelatococcus sambhunathii]
MTATTCEVAVVGGGPAGLLAALLVAQAGAETVLVAPPPRPDARTTALLDGSVSVLRSAGVWSDLLPQAAPLRSLRIVDVSRRLFRAPEALFHASELGLDAFGWNVANAAITAALGEALRSLPNARLIEAAAETARPGENGVEISVAGRTVTARLAIAADGRESLLRQAAGIGFKTRRAPQDALAFSAAHGLPHRDVSTELHSEEGPFTMVPMPGLRSSFVWGVTPEHADRLMALSPDALSQAATAASGRLLGGLSIDGRVGRFPIVIGAAKRFSANRVMLVGEAGHVLPPIGAQGLNLGVRDAAAVARIARAERAAGRDVGGDAALTAYARARAADAWTRTAATDLLNRSLLTDFLPVQAARGLALAAISRIRPLRRFVMREGLIGGPAL